MNARLSENRYFGAVLLIPVLAAFFFGGIYLHIVVSLMGLRAMYEFFHVTKVKESSLLAILAYVFGAATFLMLMAAGKDFVTVSLMVIAYTVTAMSVSVFHREYSYMDAAHAVLGFIYTCVFFACMILVYDLPHGNVYIFMIFTTSWVTDTCAYFAGKLWGKRKLIPLVSPKKTVEGAIGGLIGGMLVTFIFGIIAYKTTPGIIHYWHFLFIGFFGSLLSQLGDLIASSIKRDCGVKDYPKLIPGHGGILDRFDSVLLSTVSVFIYLTAFIFR